MDVLNYDKRLHSAEEEVDEVFNELVQLTSRLEEIKCNQDYLELEVKALQRDLDQVLVRQTNAMNNLNDVKAVYN